MTALVRADQIPRWHEKNHGPGPVETCWDCGRQKAKCRSKVHRFDNSEDAKAAALAFNLQRGYAESSPMVSYLCPWCGMYHLTSKLRRRRAAVTKQMRKWKVKQELERRAA